MNRKKCVIAVPIYKTEFNWDEFNSIKQLFKILKPEKYDIIVFCPESLDTSYYESNFDFLVYYRFWDSYFTNYPSGYNSLMLHPGFYEVFKDYEYMFIYQPDCWVFRDELEYWVNKDYDYVGAPFYFRAPDYLVVDEHIGNGGLSLRKIDFFINVCTKYRIIIDRIVNSNDIHYGEDHFFIELLSNNINIKINLPTFYEALHFSFEINPQFSYQIIENKLPFCCHSYKNIQDSFFWDDFICYDRKRYSVVTFLFGDYDVLRDPIVIDDNAEYICITDRTDLQSDIWRFENITEYDISNYTDWQKTMIARYTALNHITTDKCIILDASIQIRKSLNYIIDKNSCCDIGVIISPWRSSYLDELDEWINTRNIDIQEKTNFIEFCNNNDFDINRKGFIMSTVMYVRKTEETYKLWNKVLFELMNNFNFSMRVDQLYLSVILFRYFGHLIKGYYSMQILNSKYFEYYYHGTMNSHRGEYIVNNSELEIREFCSIPEICKYL